MFMATLSTIDESNTSRLAHSASNHQLTDFINGSSAGSGFTDGGGSEQSSTSAASTADASGTAAEENYSYKWKEVNMEYDVSDDDEEVAKDDAHNSKKGGIKYNGDAEEEDPAAAAYNPFDELAIKLERNKMVHGAMLKVFARRLTTLHRKKKGGKEEAV